MLVPRAVARKRPRADGPTPSGAAPAPINDAEAFQPVVAATRPSETPFGDAKRSEASLEPTAEPSKIPRSTEDDENGSTILTDHPSRGSVLFLQGVAPGTSRQQLQEELEGMLDDAGVEYVDLERSLDRCHVRLSSAAKAQDLLDALLTQARGDAMGGVASEEGDGEVDVKAARIQAERISGRREQIYLERVPRHARRRAR